MTGLAATTAEARREARTPPARSLASRTVELLRYILPAIALALVALVVLWPQLIGGAGGLIAPIFANAEIEGADVMLMHNPRYVGQTKDAEPYELTAASAYIDPKRPNRVHLDHLAAELTPASKRNLNLVALKGLYYRADDKLDLDGDIELTTSDGYRFETQSARINLERGRVIGEQPIQGFGPTGTLSADRFEIRDGGDLLRFEGRVKVTLPPRQPRDEAS
jgi:lipopolysaccharide export system protein LptC